MRNLYFCKLVQNRLQTPSFIHSTVLYFLSAKFCFMQKLSSCKIVLCQCAASLPFLLNPLFLFFIQKTSFCKVHISAVKLSFCQKTFFLQYAWIQRGEGGRGDPPPPGKLQKKNHEATKQAFSVEQPSAR